MGRMQQCNKVQSSKLSNTDVLHIEKDPDVLLVTVSYFLEAHINENRISAGNSAV